MCDEHHISGHDVMRLLLAHSEVGGDAAWRAKCTKCAAPLKWNEMELQPDEHLLELMQRIEAFEVGDGTYLGERADKRAEVYVRRVEGGWMLRGTQPEPLADEVPFEDAFEVAGLALNALEGHE